ncbi:TPA: hypothetical protein QDA71_000464 [Burkholderia vietnamiensis]|uniref:Uncharacterized protein n=1 Tax=Burkholderia vietnamiensis TaxID=60552 RepID=A0ABS1AR22_BURVI|nr:hypothetical protein [Burkholderia vietnamiensis]KVG03670.1 hypothetical protein WJ21_03085 [Burkholderia vietnamiensis]KVR66275.1 hypothetical protein WK24_17415 [Burkholderia vietnamiensis]KVS00555.1 hypothetical protein WK28_30650 [Burkholderia vietnamiensis]MBJ9686585.1 hypothetical protein [Burkholderia vietnamiensis]MBR8159623.1 hypothetical protein [Burkholderia vietnamiensis]
MAFNTHMPFPEHTVTTFDPAAACAADHSSDTAVVDESAAKPDADATANERRAARAGGRGRRVRFGDVPDDAPPQRVTGAIALSFAVVSRRHWPR